VENTPSRQIIGGATQHAKFLRQQASKGAKENLPRKRGRQKQYTVTCTDQPNMHKLTSTQPEAVERWRLALAAFLPQARAYRQHQNPQYQIKIKRWVEQFVWMQISRYLLSPMHRTKRHEPANDGAVADFLLRTGQHTRASHQFVADRYGTLAAQPVQESINAAMREDLMHTYERAMTSRQEPQMRVLGSGNMSQIRQWQHEFEIFVHRAATYRRQHDPNFNIIISRYVHPDIWNHISENLIREDRRTIQGTQANDQEVQHFLMRSRSYAPPTRMTTRKTQIQRSPPRKITARKSQSSRTSEDQQQLTTPANSDTSDAAEYANENSPSSVETSIDDDNMTDTEMNESNTSDSPDTITSTSYTNEYDEFNNDDSGGDARERTMHSDSTRSINNNASSTTTTSNSPTSSTYNDTETSTAKTNIATDDNDDANPTWTAASVHQIHEPMHIDSTDSFSNAIDTASTNNQPTSNSSSHANTATPPASLIRIYTSVPATNSNNTNQTPAAESMITESSSESDDNSGTSATTTSDDVKDGECYHL